MKIGVIGCGNISKTYFNNAKRFKDIELYACADIRKEAAEAAAAEFGIKAMSVDEILDCKEIGLIVNLTIPVVHAELNMKILKSGKHVYCEKPLALTMEDAEETLMLAKKKKLRVGCAPDTFMGAGLQTCRKLIDEGWIGKPIAGTITMMGRGPEKWHPNAPIFYQKGGGPMLDMGPYYMTALVHLLGPAKSVSAYVGKAFEERTGGAGEYAGKKFKVEVPTHYSGTIEFHNGALINVAISFDIYRHCHNPIEIYGTEGSLICPDPNAFGGTVKLYKPGNENWNDIPYAFAYKENSRILGAADIISALKTGRTHRASGELAHHVLEIMFAFEESSKRGTKIQIKSKCAQPEPMKNLEEGILD